MSLSLCRSDDGHSLPESLDALRFKTGISSVGWDLLCMASNGTGSDSTGKSSGRRCCKSRMRRDLFATSSRRSAGICRKVTQSSSSMKLWTRFANGIHFNRCFFFRPVFVVFSDLLRQWSHMYEVNWRDTHPLGGGIVTKYVPTARKFRNWHGDTCQDPKLVTTSRDLLRCNQAATLTR
jgi:hypothetical protein